MLILRLIYDKIFSKETQGETYMEILILIFSVLAFICSAIAMIKSNNNNSDTVRKEMDGAVQRFGDIISKNQRRNLYERIFRCAGDYSQNAAK